MTRLLLLLMMLCGLFSASNALAFQHAHANELSDFDKRKADSFQSSAVTAAAMAQINPGHAADLTLEFDEITGSPKAVSAKTKFLSGKKGKGGAIAADTLARFPAVDRHRTTKAFVEDHHGLFRHGADEIEKAKIRREHSSKYNGLRTTVWQQELDGLPVFDAYFVSHVTKDEELVSVSSRLMADPIAAADPKQRNKAKGAAKPTFSAERAIVLAAENLGEKVEVGTVTEKQKYRGPAHLRLFQAAHLVGETYAGLVWVPFSPEVMRLGWEVMLTGGEHGETFLMLVDAETGEVILRRGLTRHLSNATYNVFTKDSPAPMSPGLSVPSATQAPFVSRETVTLSALNTNASPNGWIPDGGNTTAGNNVYAQLDRNGDDQPDSRPQGTARVFDFPVDLGQAPTTYGDASVVQLFYWCNWAHDKLYELGFTEDAGNFQLDNFGRGGYGGDAVQADAQDRLNLSLRNNASFTTPADGLPGRLQVLIYDGADPDRDPSFDAHIVLHEYVHGMTDRMVAGGMGMVAQTTQSRGMAEGWSDFYALALLSEAGDDLHGTYPFAPYVAYKGSPTFEQNYYFGIRRYPYSTDLAKHPLTFKDIDPFQIGAYPSVPRSTYPLIAPNADSVHNQGEVWCATLWEARANLITKHGFAVGNTMILQLVTDALRLSPPNPNFLQARDAILLADRINNDGANQSELWAAFAKRGMGFFASSPASTTTQGVVESFAVPDDLSISPDAGLVSNGTVGGPFSPNAITYVFSNIGPSTVTWSADSVATWLTLSESSGSIPSGGLQTVVASINQSVAGTLATGIYTNTVWFTNTTTGIGQHRSFELRIGQPDWLTEFFNVNDFDLSYQSFTFTPDGSSSSFYSVCRAAITDFPSDPSGGTPIALGDDSSAQIALPGNVSIYTNTDNKVYVGSNGYLTWGNGDNSRLNQQTAHFSLPRVSALFTDLIPATNSISWKSFTNRIAVTYSNVLEWGTYKANNFQMELFFDGRIRISYLAMGTRNGLVGLSRGGGVPSSFVESDYSGYTECAPSLIVEVPSAALESQGLLSAAGTVRIGVPLLNDLTVSFFLSDSSELTLPSEVIIPAGETSVSFDIEIVDDFDFDGSRPVTITATGEGFQNGRGVVQVHDDEVATLGISIPTTATEGSGVISGSVYMQDFFATDDVEVTLYTDAPHRISVPATVTIPAGQSSVIFDAIVVENSSIDGEEQALLYAEVVNWQPGSAAIVISDNENFDLQLRIPAHANESNGNLKDAGSVHISGTLPFDLPVELQSTAPEDVSVPAFVLIPAGQTFATFDLNIVDDAVQDGTQNVQVQAAQEGFIAGMSSITVTDDETPAAPSNPRPADLSDNNPTTVTLEWDPTLGEGTEQLTNGGFELGTTEGSVITTNINGDVTLFRESYSLPSIASTATNYSGHFSLALKQEDAGLTTVTRTVALPPEGVLTMGWSDRIVNTGTSFDSNHGFRVELRNTNDLLLTTLFETSENSTSINEWVTRQVNVSPWCGQTVKIVFVVNAIAPGLTVLLDDISVRASNPPLTTYDVYFGTNASPELAGSTTNLSWELPPLDPFTTYYWQVVSRRIGEAAGPVWQFATVPSLLVTDIAVAEGDSGVSAATFHVQLTTSSPDQVAVKYATVSGTALSDSDFAYTNGTLYFEPGETNKVVEVLIHGDGDFEGDETFYLRFTNALNAALITNQAACTILEDDSILFPISNKTVDEGSLLTFAVETGSPGDAVTELITDFENHGGTSNGTVMFREPLQASSAFLDNSPSFSIVTNTFPGEHSGTQVLAVSCSFKNTANPWLRLSTAPSGNVPNPQLPNPTVNLQQAVQFDVYADRTIRLGLGIRETGTTNAIGEDGGTSGTVEFVGVTNKVIGPNTPMPVRTITNGSWQRVTFTLPTEPITGLDGNGILSSSSGKGTLAHLAILPSAGSGLYHFYFDNFAVVYTNQLFFSLSNAPAGASINPQTGVFSWTPSEEQGPGIYEISVTVTDGATVNETRTFSVTVNEANSIPSLATISSKTIPEQSTLSFTAVASDSDLPANTLNYSLDAAPAGATIDPVSGVFTWTPTEAQGPSTNTVVVRVTDNGSPALSQPTTFFIYVTETNAAPSLAVIPDQSVSPNGSVSFQVVANDPDLPANQLTFSLIGTPPAGATIDPQSGVFNWQNITAPGGSTNTITVRVQDNGNPILEATRTFTVVVSGGVLTQSIQLNGNQITLSWNTTPEQNYSVQYSTNLVQWTELQQVNASGSTASLVQTTSEQKRFYRIQLLP